MPGANIVTLAVAADCSNVAGSASSVPLLAANPARRGAAFANDSAAILYLKCGATASATSFTVAMAPASGGVPSYYELPQPCYTGVVEGVWTSATGSARITEFSE